MLPLIGLAGMKKFESALKSIKFELAVCKTCLLTTIIFIECSRKQEKN